MLLLVLDQVESRGGRGGRFGGSRFRSSRYRSRVRSSRVSRVPVRTKYSGHRLGSSNLKKAAIIAGTVYGARLWMSRSTYRSHHSYPEVCYNDIYEGNMTQKYYGRFVCPGYSDPDSYRYCCGSVGSQSCCDEPFDSSSSQGAGRIAGLVIGILFAVVVVGVCAYCCFKKRKSFQGKTLTTESAKPLQPMGYAAAPPPPTTMTYGVQPLEDGNLPQPPSYGDVMNQPYPTPAPFSDPAYKPPMPTDDVNRGDLPYGIKPEPTPGSGYMYGQSAPPDDTPYPSAPGEPAAYPPPGGAAPYPSAPGGAAPYPSAPGGFVAPPGGFVAPSGGNSYPQ